MSGRRYCVIPHMSRCAFRQRRYLHEELDRLDPQLLRQRRLVLPNLADHRLGGLPLEEELHDLFGLGADDTVEEARLDRMRMRRRWLG